MLLLAIIAVCLCALVLIVRAELNIRAAIRFALRDEPSDVSYFGEQRTPPDQSGRFEIVRRRDVDTKGAA